MKIRICVGGATGWAGRALVNGIARTGDMELVAAVSPKNKDRKLSAVTGNPLLDVTISGSVADALNTAADVYVDYTTAEAVKENVLHAIRRNTHVVIGASGLTDTDYTEIDTLARKQGVGVIAVGNFAVTAVLMQRFAEMAARYIPQWEIIDYAGADKIDTPSGTARELAFRMAQVKKPQVAHPRQKSFSGCPVNG